MGEPPKSGTREPRIAASLAWLLIVVLGVGYGIGGYGLIEPDEGRNAEVAREMAESNNYVLPHLNGLPYLDKPVLFFAAVAASIELFGANEFAARLAPLLFALATAGIAGWFAYRLWGRGAGVIAVTASATAPLALGLSRTVIMDTALSLFVVLALVSFFYAVESRSDAGFESPLGWPWLAWTLVAWAAIGLGVLTKGPVAFAVPLLVAAPYAWRRRASLAVWHPLGLVLMVVVVLPWVWAVSRQIPNFLHYVVVTETWARMTSNELHRTEPVWFFLPVLLVGAFPWSVVALSGVRVKGADERAVDRQSRLYLWLWIVVPLVLFSLSRGKQEQYVLPLVPAVALLVAGRWRERRAGVRIAALMWAILGAALLVVAVLGVPGLDTTRVSTATATSFAIGFGVAAVAGGAAAWFSFARKPEAAAVGLALPLLVFPVVGSGLVKSVAADRSTRRLSSAIEGRLKPGTELIWVESFAPGVSYYLGRTIPVASVDGDELRSNYVLRNSQEFFQVEGQLRPLESAIRSVVDCSGPLIVLLSTQNALLDESIREAGAPLLDKTRRWIAYGPACPIVDHTLNELLVDPKVSD